MSRFIQYPFDKTKMTEVRQWVNEAPWPAKLRSIDGVQNVKFSFCPGEGWLAAHYTFNDLDAMKAFFGNPVLGEVAEAVKNHPNFDSSRQPHEFKGFYLWEV
jgi:hypothetical protein